MEARVKIPHPQASTECQFPNPGAKRPNLYQGEGPLSQFLVGRTLPPLHPGA